MAGITLKERQRINHELKKSGFGGLDDPNIFAQIATLYQTHEAFRGLLMSTAPDQRRIAYESLCPHLMFTPKPLDVYEREIKEKAEREQWDVWNGTAYPQKFRVGEIESEEYRLARLAQESIEQAEHEKAKGVLSLICKKCTVRGDFPAPNRRQATKAAHDFGWRWEEKNGTKKTYCPEHVPGRCSMTLTCSREECGKVVRLRVWDEQDGYRDARRLGWEIGDVAVCPSCSVKHIVLQ
jgi:hypothetical protein